MKEGQVFPSLKTSRTHIIKEVFKILAKINYIFFQRYFFRGEG